MQEVIPMKKLPYKIMLDRYSDKDLSKKTLNTGTIIVATVDESDPIYPQKEICKVISIGVDNTIKMVNLFDSEDTYELHIDKVSVPKELVPDNIWSRVALGNAKNEKDKNKWYDEFFWALSDWRFVPGGRIMAMLGSDNQANLTAFNCFVIPCPHDSRGGAIQALDRMIEIMARGGGVGINLSTLRPRNAIVRGVSGTSSGAVSWGGGYSYYTGLVEQGGSRRGALLEGLAVWHPDIEEFIDVKKTPGQMTNANLSVLLTEDFMNAVYTNSDWVLQFPETSHSAYNTEWDGNLSKWKQNGYPVNDYKTVPAKYLWDKIIQSNWASAEPGVIWIERYNNLSNSWYIQEVVCTNPCGEQGLPPWGVCNLGHVNLSRVPLDPTQEWGIDWSYLNRITRDGVRFLDNVIDITPYFYEENEKVQKDTRRIGMGTMGFAELLIKLGIRYGSEKSLNFVDALYAFIRDTAYDESVELAKEKGAFPLFDAEKFLQGGFVKQLPDPLKAKIKKYGIRNVALLTQAPTGSTGTMCDTSTGIEPFYDWIYVRSGRLGKEVQFVRVVAEYLKDNGISVNPEDMSSLVLPDYFVSAKKLTPEEHITVMARIQRYTDSSISKTVNCPADFTVEDVDKLYQMAYALGCKGLTIYRDNSRDTQVLESLEKKAAPMKKLEWGQVMKVPQDTIYREVKFKTGCGKIRLHIGTSASHGNRVIHIYTIVSSAGGCQMNIQGEAIAISKFLRAGGRIETLLEDSQEAGICPSYQFKRGQGQIDLYGRSCFNGLARAIVDFQNGTLPEYVEVQGPPYEGVIEGNDAVPEVAISKKEVPKVSLLADDCPSCGKKMVKETGCWQCKNCGFSKCE